MKESDRRDWLEIGIIAGACIAIALITIFGAVRGANAQGMPCTKADVAARSITGKFGETPVSSGVVAGGKGRFIMWRNAETGTWTLTFQPAARPDMLCPMASGDGYEEATPLPDGEQS